jgi:hypothetical protein
MQEQLLTIDDIAAKFRASRRTVAEHWIQRPDFPPPKYAPTRRSRLWLAGDVERWATPDAARSAAPTHDSTCSQEPERPGGR